MFMGSAIHDLLDHKGVYDELTLSTNIYVPHQGEIHNFEVRGTVDSYDITHGRLVDYKTTSREFLVLDRETGRRKKRELPEASHVLQTNIYRLLLEDNGYDVNEIYIWYVRTVPNAPREFVAVPLLDKDEVYLRCVELAQPLLHAQLTGELPACTCQYRSGLDPDLCNEVDWEVDLSRVPEAA